MLKKGFIFICYLISLGSPQLLYADNYTEQLTDLKKYYQEENYHTVISKGNELLVKHSDDPDIRYFMGLAYYQLKQYNKAIDILAPALTAYPAYLDVRIALIDAYFAKKSHFKASELIEDGLQLEPENKKLRMRKVKFFILEKKYSLATKELKDILSIDNDYEAAIDQQKKLEELKRTKKALLKKKTEIPALDKKVKEEKNLKAQYVLGASTSSMDVTLPNEYWNYSTLSLYRLDSISYGAELNYANRLNHQAIQGGLKLIPKLGKNTWINLAYYYANTPELFPDHTLYGELHQNLFENITVSAGGYHQKITHTYFDTFTGSITAYINNFMFSVRPLYYQPKSGPDSLLYRFHVRYYADNPDNYFGLIYYTGYSPDLFNLMTVNFFRVHEKIIMAESQFVIHKSLLMTLGGGFQRQRFLNNRVRDLTYLNIGIKYRFGYV